MDQLPRRQLTAILFADIVGYTALMQSNEQQALANLQKFKRVLEKLVPLNNGAIIQYYGDACLATFNSSADAANCAVSMQFTFQDNPRVPVRIGIHSGEVVFKEGNVFGDAVNIASRIESMGVPGSVLVSSSVRNQIKNKENFSLASLGKFEFKNVEDAMTVYALANGSLIIPKPEQLKGKSKLVKESSSAKSYNYPLIIGGLVAALVASFAYFGLRPTVSQAMTTQEVSIVNEAGEAETRMVPTAEFTRKFVSFPFEVDLEDSEADWLSLALPILFNNDMEQDMRLSGIAPTDLKSEYDIYNQTFPKPISFATQIKVAQDFFTDFFITGKIYKGDLGTYKIDLKVNETENGKLFLESTVEGNDLFNLVDQLSAQLNEQLYLPEAQGSKVQMIDLPVKELVTANNDALKNYIESQILYTVNPQAIGKSIELLQQSTELDPNCTDCFFTLAQYQFISNNQTDALQTIEQARLLAESQPERKKMDIRAYQLNLNQEFQKMIQLYENWRKLYPNDINPYNKLIFFYRLFNNFDKAKEIGLAAIDNGHRGRFMTQLADIYIHTQEYGKAENLLKEYAQIYPHKANKTYELADIYIAQGKLEEALSFYQNLTLMEGNDIKGIIGLSSVQDKLGQFDEAEKTLTDFLVTARLPQDSMQVFTQLENHFLRLGQYEPFFDNYQKRLAIIERIAPPIAKLNVVFSRLQHLIFFKKENLSFKYLGELEMEIPAFQEIINCLGNFFIHFQMRDLTKFNEIATDEKCKTELIKNFGVENGKYLFEGFVANANGDFAKAAENFETYLDNLGASAEEFEEELVKIYRKNKDFDKANDLFNKLLKTDPNDASMLFEGAKLKLDQGDKTTATELLNKALGIWSNADSYYITYQDAIEFGKTELGLEL